MNKRRLRLLMVFLLILGGGIGLHAFQQQRDDPNILSYTADPKKQHLALHWKDDKGQIIGSLGRMNAWTQSRGRQLLFAMNGGMYMEDRAPLGLYIENGRTLRPLNRRTASGNFYMKPNGVFYLTKDRRGVVCRTEDFRASSTIQYATQSGPLLLINGRIHPMFQKGSRNLNVRNGVGILPGNKVLFAMSKGAISFYDFAEYFRSRGCRWALYLDGFVSRAWLPEKGWKQTHGAFGAIITVIE